MELQSGLGVVLAFLAGVVSFLSPCVLPVIPVYLSLISGLSYEQLQAEEGQKPSRAKLLGSALAFLIGFGVVIVLLLGGILQISQFSPQGRLVLAIFRWVGAAALVVFALHMFGVFRIRALYQEKRFHISENKYGLLGAALIGAAFAFGWTPCIGPILGGVLTLSADNPSFSLVLLTTYVVGLAVPFLLAALFVSTFLASMRKLTRYLRAVEIGSGVLLILIAGLLVTNQLTAISTWAINSPLGGLAEGIEGWLERVAR